MFGRNMTSPSTFKVWTVVGQLGEEVHYVSNAFGTLAEAEANLKLAESEYEDLSLTILEDDSLAPAGKVPMEE